MPVVFIDGKAVTLKSIRVVGEPLTENDADILNHIWLKRISAKLRYLLDRNVIDSTTIQNKARELASEDMAPYSILEDGDDDDPVLVEAIDMAKAIIMSRLTQENLPMPKTLDVHAKELLRGIPALVEKARLRVEARYKAAHDLLGEV